MEKHIRVARVHRLLSWFYLFAFVALAGLVAIVDDVPRTAYLVLVLPAALFVLHHVIGNGARARRPWARVASIVVACFMVLGFPIGTIIGVYLLVNNWSTPAAGGWNASA